MENYDKSERFDLSKVGFYKALRLLLVTMVAAGITILPQIVGGFDFGIYNVPITTMVSFFVEVARRYVTDYSKK